MNRFESWILKGVIRKAVMQGGHAERITDFYGLLVQAARIEFFEDNEPTIDGLLIECHAAALEKNLIKDIKDADR